MGGWTPEDPDYYVIPQKSFTADEHDVWRMLYKRQMELLPGRAYTGFFDALSTLGIHEEKIPDLDELSAKLQKITGWQAVTVPGQIPDDAWLELIAARRFAVYNNIPSREELNNHSCYLYLFCDIFGRIPQLVNPVLATTLETFGKVCLEASSLATMQRMGNLCYDVLGQGLIQEPQGLRLCGYQLLSHAKETVFCLDDPSPNRIKFDIRRNMRTHHLTDEFRATYFIIDDFQQILDAFREPLEDICNEIAHEPDYAPDAIAPDDIVIHRGTGEYAREAEKRRLKREKELLI